MKYFTDTHCHLDFPNFDQDREIVLSNAKKAGLAFICNPGIDLETSKKSIQLSKQNPGFIYSGIGFHPNYGNAWQSSSISDLRELANNKEVIAIGEIGLDHYRKHTAWDDQENILIDQLNLASELRLPVLLHNRDATENLLPIVRSWIDNLDEDHPQKKKPGVFHSFSDSLDTALEAIDLGFLIGISGPITFSNAPERKEIVANLPLNHLLLETDSPFLTPHPYRGQRCEPAYIPYIAKEIAMLHSATPEEIAIITFQNAITLFNITY